MEKEEESKKITSELDGLILESFLNSIRPFTFSFKDQDSEAAYCEDKLNMRFMSSSSRKFLYALFIGFCGLIILDCISAAGYNPDYLFPQRIWIAESCLILLPIIEGICFFWKKAALFRGVTLTILGGIVLVHNTFYFSIISGMIRPSLGPKYGFYNMRTHL